MKTLLALLAFTLTAHGAELERVQPSHLSLTAGLTANAAGQRDHFPTDYGSSDIHTEKSRSATATVRNLGRDPATVELRAEWFGKFTGGNGRLLLATEAREVAVGPGGTATLASSSGTIRGSDLNLVMIGVRSTSGARIEGWVFTVRDAGTKALLACKGSDSHLEELARTPGAVAALPKLSAAAKTPAR